MIKVFINGGSGTTGLRIAERLQARPDIALVTLPEERRKVVAAQAELAAQADITFLCLPDEASRALIDALGDEAGRVLDTSTAFRTDPRFTYGFAELSAAQEAAIRGARRVAVPGCHASGAIALLSPLVAAGVLAADAPLSLTSLTGYSGGGKSMIAAYEAPDRPAAMDAPNAYALGLTHKHLPEITHVCGLNQPPVLLPVLGDYYAGMTVLLPLPTGLLRPELTLAGVSELYRAHYAGQALVRTLAPNPAASTAGNTLAGSDLMQVFVTGNDQRMVAVARFDNLGKGASGAAIQCMNLMLGLDPATGLVTDCD